MITRSPRRAGFTLFEIVIVLAILVLMAALIVPSVVSFRGDTRQRAAADVIRTELANARARAKEEGKPYRVAISEDFRRLRRAPDDAFAQAAVTDQAISSAPAIEYTFEGVTVEPVAEPNAEAPKDVDGWITIAEVKADGTFGDGNLLLTIKEEGQADSGLYLRIRGLTGTARVVPNPNAPGATSTPSGGMK